jgi:hypothetical protein
MLNVRRHQERALEKDLLALPLRYVVQLPILLGGAGVPLKPSALSQVIREARHVLCIY